MSPASESVNSEPYGSLGSWILYVTLSPLAPTNVRRVPDVRGALSVISSVNSVPARMIASVRTTVLSLPTYFSVSAYSSIFLPSVAVLGMNPMFVPSIANANSA